MVFLKNAVNFLSGFNKMIIERCYPTNYFNDNFIWPIQHNSDFLAGKWDFKFGVDLFGVMQGWLLGGLNGDHPL